MKQSTGTTRTAQARCACGCGERVTRTFKPGHDAKLRVALVKAAVEGRQFTLYGKKHDPMALAEEHGIGHQVRTRVYLERQQAKTSHAAKRRTA